MQNNYMGSITDDASVARPISDKLKRQTRTLGQALGFVVTGLRVKEKWSQGDLARKSGFEITTINRLEQGKANPTMALVIAMADSFGLRPSELLSRAERKCMKHGWLIRRPLALLKDASLVQPKTGEMILRAAFFS
jgi:transcriptional regulator with XRE-family HTH domain